MLDVSGGETHELTLDTAVEDDFNQGNNGVDTILADDIEGGELAVAEGLITCRVLAEKRGGRCSIYLGCWPCPLEPR